ncbi:MAG: helix-turn-helix domain-containing protein [Myxococcota bacterium]
MAERCYHQFCGVAKALDMVGERWTLLIVRDLLLGGRRFSDLLSAMPGLTPNLLSRRLKQLQEAELIVQQKLSAPHSATLYVLTERGRQLEPVVLALGRFGSQMMTNPGPNDRIDPRWAMVSLKRRYLGCPRPWTVGLHLPERELRFTVVLGGEVLEVRDGAPANPDLHLEATVPAFAGFLLRGMSGRELVESGALKREGPARALADFARAFGITP